MADGTRLVLEVKAIDVTFTDHAICRFTLRAPWPPGGARRELAVNDETFVDKPGIINLTLDRKADSHLKLIDVDDPPIRVRTLPLSRLSRGRGATGLGRRDLPRYIAPSVTRRRQSQFRTHRQRGFPRCLIADLARQVCRSSVDIRSWRAAPRCVLFEPHAFTPATARRWSRPISSASGTVKRGHTRSPDDRIPARSSPWRRPVGRAAITSQDHAGPQFIAGLLVIESDFGCCSGVGRR